MRALIQTEQEASYAAAIGEIRHVDALKLGKKDCHGFKPDPLQTHIFGARGESECAKILKRPWPARINEFRAGKPDIDPNIEVCTRSESWHELIVRPSAHDDRLYVLIIAAFAPLYIAAGYMSGKEAKQHDEWKKNHGGKGRAYFVPQWALRDIDELSASGSYTSLSVTDTMSSKTAVIMSMAARKDIVVGDTYGIKRGLL